MSCEVPAQRLSATVFSSLKIFLRLPGGGVKKEEDRRALQMTSPGRRCQVRESRTQRAVYDRILTAGASSKLLRSSLHRAGSTAATIGERPTQGLGTYVQAGRSADYGLGGSGDPSPSPLLGPTVRGFAVQVSSTETSGSGNVVRVDATIPSSRADPRRTSPTSPWMFSHRKSSI